MKKADITIKEHQEFIIEQERLKSLLQMSVATTHELGQPLTVLLGNIELMGIYKDNPEKLAQCITKIKEAGKRIATIIKKVQNIRHADIGPYPKDISGIESENQ